MPVVSMFYGIIILMFCEIGGKHHEPHIHVNYQDDEAVYRLDGLLLEGKIPRKQSKLVEAWIEIHHDELIANWKLASSGERIFRIDPLK